MNYHDITKDDMRNGEGLRVVLWVSGCAHHCKGCQNPLTWNPDDGLPFDEAAKNELLELLSRDYISGITFSGGDPLFPGNRKEILRLCETIRREYPKKTIWLYTGYLWEEIRELSVTGLCDVVIEGPYVEELRDLTLKWRGSSNQRVIDVKKSREEDRVILHCS